MIFTIDASSFPKVIDEQNTLHIPKYERQNFACWCCIFGRFGRLSLADCWFDSRVKWWIYISSIFTYLHKNSFFLHWNSDKQHSESTTHCCFWSTVNKCGTHFEHSFLIDKYSGKMVNTLPSDIFNFSIISCDFNLQSAKIILWSFLVFSETTAKFGQPLHQYYLYLYNHI